MFIQNPMSFTEDRPCSFTCMSLYATYSSDRSDSWGNIELKQQLFTVFFQNISSTSNIYTMV